MLPIGLGEDAQGQVFFDVFELDRERVAYGVADVVGIWGRLHDVSSGFVQPNGGWAAKSTAGNGAAADGRERRKRPARVCAGLWR